jgi:hypothetical protein
LGNSDVVEAPELGKGKKQPRIPPTQGVYLPFLGGQIMKLGLIAIGLMATTGVVYAACIFC